MSTHFGNVIGLGRGDYEHMYTELRTTEGGKLAGPYHSEVECRTECCPHSLVTNLRFPESPSIFAEDTGMIAAGYASLRYTANVIRVPELPITNIFAYYIESKWAAELLWRVLREGVDMGPVEHAAVLEELSIY